MPLCLSWLTRQTVVLPVDFDTGGYGIKWMGTGDWKPGHLAYICKVRATSICSSSVASHCQSLYGCVLLYVRMCVFIFITICKLRVHELLMLVSMLLQFKDHEGVSALRQRHHFLRKILRLIASLPDADQLR